MLTDVWSDNWLQVHLLDKRLQEGEEEGERGSLSGRSKQRLLTMALLQGSGTAVLPMTNSREL